MKYWQRDLNVGAIEYIADEYPKGYWTIEVWPFPHAQWRLPNYFPIPFESKAMEWKPADEKVVTEAFQKAWCFMYEKWPELLLPPLRPKFCACGCGKPVEPGRVYADPKACKVRAFRKNGKKPDGFIKPAVEDPTLEKVIDLEWFRIEYYRMGSDSHNWMIRRTVDGGKRSATTNGFVDLNCQFVDEPELIFGKALDMAKCILDIDYRAQEYPTVLWNIAQHFALCPNNELLRLSATKHWHTLANRRVDRAAALMPVTPTTVEDFITLLTGGIVKERKVATQEPKKPTATKALKTMILKRVNDSPNITAKSIAEMLSQFSKMSEAEALAILLELTGDGKVSRKNIKGEDHFGYVGFYEQFVRPVKQKPEAERLRWEKIVIDAMVKRGKDFDYAANYLWGSKGHKAGGQAYERFWKLAWKRLQAAGKIIHNGNSGDYQCRLSDEMIAIHFQPEEKQPKLGKDAEELLNGVQHYINNRADRTAHDVSKFVYGDERLDEIRVALNILVQEKKIDRQKRGDHFFYAPLGFYKSQKVSTETK